MHLRFVALCITFAATTASANQDGVVRLSLSHDGRYVAASYLERDADHPTYLKVWDVRTGKERWKLDSTNGSVMGVRFSPDDKLLGVSMSEEPLKLYDATTGKLVRDLKRDSEPERSPLYTNLAFSFDGTQICGLAEGGVYVFDVTTGKEITPAPIIGRVNSAIGLPDKRWMFDSGETWKPGMKFPKHDGIVSENAIFSPDHKSLVDVDSASSNGGLRVYDLATMRLSSRTAKDLEIKNPRAVAIDPRAKWAVVATYDGLDWFDYATMKHLYTWKHELFDALDVAYGPTGAFIVTGHRDGVVRVVDVTATKPRVLFELGKPLASWQPDAKAMKDDGDGNAKPKVDANYIGTPASPKDERLLAEVAEAASDARNPPGYDSDPTEYGKACMDAVKKALAAKVPDTAEVHFGSVDDLPGSRKDPDSGGFRYVPLRVINTEVCIPAFGRGYLSKLAQSASLAAGWIEKIQEGGSGAYAKDLKDGSLLKFAVDEGKQCMKRVAEARKAGIPDSAMVDYQPGHTGIVSPLSIADTERLVCKVALAGTSALKDKDDARVAAAYAPYLKVLTGDRARLFKSEGMLGSVYYYGPGKKLLKTPADFKNARVWYWYSYDHDHVPATWNVSGFKFKGDAQAGTYSKAGKGQDAPASAFP